MGKLTKREDERVGLLFSKIAELIDKESDIEVSVSALSNLIIVCWFLYGKKRKMDIEEFILYINAVLKDLKTELLNENRLKKAGLL